MSEKVCSFRNTVWAHGGNAYHPTCVDGVAFLRGLTDRPKKDFNLGPCDAWQKGRCARVPETKEAESVERLLRTKQLVSLAAKWRERALTTVKGVINNLERYIGGTTSSMSSFEIAQQITWLKKEMEGWEDE